MVRSVFSWGWLMNFAYVNEIVSQLLSNTFSVFCGAGASADITNSKWEDIFCETTREFYRRKLSDDIYFLADLEKHYYNADNFYKDIVSVISNGSGKESAHINGIINLNLNQVWTTNFDTHIEETIYRKYGVRPTVIKDSKDLFSASLNGPYIVYKLNGSVEDTSSMVLTKSDFFDYFKKQRLMFELLKRQLVLDSFLFVGYSFKDDLVLNALREIKEIFPEQGKQHYRFSVEVPSNGDTCQDQFRQYERRYFEDKYNIKTIQLQSYHEIDLYLGEIYKRFCNHNVFICGSFREISREARFQIEQLVDHLIRRLFEHGFNVYSGNGRGLGEIVVARSNKYQEQTHGKLINRPFIFTGDSTPQKREKNKLIMKDCNTMIIICGQDESLSTSKNVLDQFHQFMTDSETGTMPLIIPLPSTGFAAKEIFMSEEFTASACCRENPELYQRINVCGDPEQLAKLVVNLIASYRMEPTV